MQDCRSIQSFLPWEALTVDLPGIQCVKIDTNQATTQLQKSLGKYLLMMKQQWPVIAAPIISNQS